MTAADVPVSWKIIGWERIWNGDRGMGVCLSGDFVTKAEREQERQDSNLAAAIFQRMYPHFPCHGQKLTKAQENHKKWVIAAIIEGIKVGRETKDLRGDSK